MSAPRRYAPARDHNEKPIVDRLSAEGWRVYRKNPVDLIVLCNWCGGAILVEVKNADGRDRLTPLQQELRGWHPDAFEIMYDPNEMRAFIEQHQKRTGCQGRG